VSNVVGDYQIGALGMFVTLSLVVSVVAPVVVVIAALRRAPEAYENERGLQIVKRVALAKKLSRSSYLTRQNSARSNRGFLLQRALERLSVHWKGRVAAVESK
jgi:hypothetical protein